MDIKEQDISTVEFDKGKPLDDYKFLVQKLKSIKDLITFLEKKFFDKEI
tara:strand:- start:151 stop:297 length:147 start_codon:yes stop_codon:yes gene_type:complete